MPALNVPEGFEYVLAAATSTMGLNFWQNYLVGKARQRSGIKYPQMYAEEAQVAKSKEALIFNCTQRAHQNTLEFATFAVLGMFVGGLKYPYLSAGLGGAYIFGRVLYTVGYITGDPQKRYTSGGVLGSLAHLGLMVTSGFAVYSFISGGL